MSSPITVTKAAEAADATETTSGMEATDKLSPCLVEVNDSNSNNNSNIHNSTVDDKIGHVRHTNTSECCSAGIHDIVLANSGSPGGIHIPIEHAEFETMAYVNVSYEPINVLRFVLLLPLNAAVTNCTDCNNILNL